MYKFLEMVERQKDYVNEMREHASKYIEFLNKNEIESILLSGSVSRGDYFPGTKGGAIDLIVMKKEKSTITVEKIFGKNENSNIPFHCKKWNEEWFQILFTDFINVSKFKEFAEPRKFSVMESKIFYDPKNKYKKEFVKINSFVKKDLKEKLEKTLGYLKYIIGKEARWERRKAYPHMHNNLNIAIELGICCLYYFNGKYAPADDRKLYYSYELEKVPKNYEKLVVELFKQKIESRKDYERRKELYFGEFLSIFEKQKSSV